MKLRKTLTGILGVAVMALSVGSFSHVNEHRFGYHQVQAQTSTTTVKKTSFSKTSDNLDDVVSYTTSQGGGTNKPAINDNEIRLYQGNPGGNIKVSVKDGYVISSVTIGSSMKTQISYAIGDGERTTSKYSIVADGKYSITDIGNVSVTIHCMGADKYNRLYVNYLEVVYSTEESDCEHNYVKSETDSKDATCTTNGELVEICSLCGDKKTSEIAAGHVLINDVCTECGKEILAYTLVENVEDLKIGDSVIIAAKDSNFALSTEQKSNNRGQVEIKKDNKIVTFGNDTQILTLQKGKVSGTFAFYTGEGYLYAASSGSNHLKTGSTLTNNGSWKITITEGTASVVAQGSYTRNVMQYNQNDSLFACYSSASQQAISIYRYNVGDNVQSLVDTYYNSGTYTRDTTINFNETAVNEISEYFHAKATQLVRTTYFTPDALWMSRGDGEYSYYGTAEGNKGVTNATANEALVTPENAKVVLSGKDKNSMEEYYTTLKDIKEAVGAAAWTKSGSVYSSTDATLIQYFLDFTAPCFLNYNESNSNYLLLSKVTIQEENNSLVLKLHVNKDGLNSGALTKDANNVLSVATITK